MSHAPSSARLSLRIAAALGALILVPGLAAAQSVSPDTDGDGISDAADAYPCDAAASAAAFAPAEDEHGLLLFEDTWPRRGDLDFNDLALGLQYRVRLNAAGRAVGLRATFNVRALGGTVPQGLGLQLPLPRGAAASVTRAIAIAGAEGAWVDGTSEAITVSTADEALTFVVSPNLRELFAGDAEPVNAKADRERRIAAPITVDVTFATPQQLDLAGAPYDVFIFRAQDRGHEIHLPQYSGTAAMNRALFGTMNDGSQPDLWFADDQHLPMVLMLPEDAAYPLEQLEISNLYPRIVDFARSGGKDALDFYLTPSLAGAYADSLGRPAPDAAPVLRATPEAFCFAPVVEAALSTVVTSPEVALRGFAGGITVAVTGGGSPQVSVNGGTWVGQATNVRAPATLRVRLTSSNQAAIRQDADVAAGPGATPVRWSVTTITVPIGQQSNPGTSCRSIREAGGGSTSGVFWLRDGDGVAYQAYCDMTSDGGGWTALFSGTNGTPHVFDGFDRAANTCTDLTTRCIRRPPAGLDNTRVEVAIACGNAMVALPMTGQIWRWLANGAQQGWVPFTGARSIGTTSVTNLPSSVYTGSGGDTSFIFAANNGSGGNTFASTYAGSTAYNYCNGSLNTSSRVRLFYRERAAVPVHNTAQTARPSCRQILDRGESRGDGVYWVQPAGYAAPHQAYCDMTLDGGGWTTLFAGQNGSPNVFDRFDTGVYQGVCTDPSTRCLRRAPASLVAAQTQIAVRHADVAVRFPLTQALHAYFTQGTQAMWQPIAAESIGAGHIAVRPNSVWTGQAGNPGFIFAAQQSSAYVLASSYGVNTTWDGGNGSYDTASLVRVMYRESDPPVDPTAEGTSCRDVLARGLSRGDGVYRLQQPGRSAYEAYCNMTTDGGGWTAVFSGTNGSTNVFDGFDDPTRPSAICTDPSARCVRRPPPSLGNTRTELMAECGSARVAFPMTTPLYNHLVNGQQFAWTNFTAARSVGTTVVTNLPDTFWTGGNGDRGFIVSRATGTGGNVFGASYAGNTAYNYCNGSLNTSTRLRLYYREAPVTPVLNAEAAAPVSCRAILDAGQSIGSGNYYIRPDANAPAIVAYCDMTLDGGGWTTIYAGQNGGVNAFDRFDTGFYSGTCTDPASRCVRRAPSALVAANTQIAVRMNDLAVRFPMTGAIRGYFVDGTPAGWQPIAAESIGAGTIAVRPNGVWTGQAGNPGFILAVDQSPSYVFASTYSHAAGWDYGNRVYDLSGLVRVMYREGTPPVDPSARGTSCLDVLRQGRANGSGIYRLQQPGRSAYDAYCDMTADGGGWTAFYSGTNGSTNVFDGFDGNDRPSAICTDVASRCVRRPPPDLNLSRVELALACGNAMVAMPMTAPLYRHFVLGERSGWQNLTGTRSIGTTAAAILPDSFYAGSGGDYGFIVARAQGSGGNTFGASYPTTTVWNYCNGSLNTSSRLRLFYRETPVYTALNAAQNAPASCRAILDGGLSQGSGTYWIQPPGASAPVAAHCDMTLDGGGWTTIYAGQNGSLNVFDTFDAPSYQGICSDPSTRCVRRAPASLVPNATDIAVAAGSVAVRFPLTPAVLGYFSAGAQAGWQPIAAESIGDGTIAVRPNAMWTGSPTSPGHIFAVDNGPGRIFTGVSSANPPYDYANGVFDVSTLVRVMYREGPPPMDPAAEGSSCNDILVRGQSRGTGLYRLQQPGSSSYVAYCDMTTDGGGWTAIYSGTNGTPHVFDGFDGTDRPAAICTDVANRCVRRPPSTIAAGATQLAVSCGNAMVRFPLTAPIRSWLLSGVRSSWVGFSGAQSIGTTAVANLPDTLYTGNGGDVGFIVARASGTGGNVFAASYPNSASYNYCNGSLNTSTRIRIFYR